ncbi:MAG TPA: hypothetical protein PLY67_02605 [Clostridiales bacterium]|nr:hypothetical protein [Clostridiales bacterium]HPU67369.1 hypothetical protein [Clostridiales bacterium]HQA05164.1 hypothetical protein [Clostridiales bacterium]HQD72291.1 hypothetical protein [Clostridiales bacterium]HXK83094.1 hypothetical protein [Clostridiales bacterium]
MTIFNTIMAAIEFSADNSALEFAAIIAAAMLIAAAIIASKLGKVAEAIEKLVSSPSATVPAPAHAAAPAAVAAAPAQRAVSHTVVLNGIDEETAAAIMAIVSHESGIPLEKLEFKSIKEID